MNRVFGEQFYQADEENEGEIKAYLNAVEEEMEGNGSQSNLNSDEIIREEKQQGLIPRPNIPTLFKHKVTSEEASRLQEQAKACLWWLCDSCQGGIAPLMPRYDCMECDNFTLCKECYYLK